MGAPYVLTHEEMVSIHRQRKRLQNEMERLKGQVEDLKSELKRQEEFYAEQITELEQEVDSQRSVIADYRSRCQALERLIVRRRGESNQMQRVRLESSNQHEVDRDGENENQSRRRRLE